MFNLLVVMTLEKSYTINLGHYGFESDPRPTLKRGLVMVETTPISTMHRGRSTLQDGWLYRGTSTALDKTISTRAGKKIKSAPSFAVSFTSKIPAEEFCHLRSCHFLLKFHFNGKTRFLRSGKNLILYKRCDSQTDQSISVYLPSYSFITPPFL